MARVSSTTVAEVAVAGASTGGMRAVRRLFWLAGVVAVVALITSYLFIAVLSHPLVSGNAEGAGGGVLQQAPTWTPANGNQIRVFDYVDGKTVTMFKWLSNSGTVPLTVTGVDTAPSYWRGLLGIQDARAVPVVESRGCCRYDDPSPWAASSFQPVVVQPGKQAAVILHVLFSNCEYSSGGALVGLSTIRVHYSVLGMPHSDEIPFVNGIFVKAPESCPRSAPIS